MDNTFLEERIVSIKARIVALEDAELALASGAIQEYTLDTGQTRQTVTKVNIATLQRTVTSLYNQYATLCARLNGAGVMAVPSW